LNHYVQNKNLQQNLKQYYDTGNQEALNSFFVDCYKIVERIVQMREYIAEQHHQEDAVQFIILTIMKLVDKKKIDADGNIFNFITSHAKFRSIDYIRKISRENSKLEFKDFTLFQEDYSYQDDWEDWEN